MRLESELFYVEKQMLSFAKEHSDLQDYVNRVRSSGDYVDLEVRIAWDILRASVGIRTICDWYEKYDCNDSHITTLAKRAIKVLGLSI